MRRWLVAAALLALGAQEPAAKKEYAKDGVLWGRTWYEAFEEARLRNVPIHFAIHDDSEDCAAMAAVYADPKYVEASRKLVHVVTNASRTHEIEVELGGTKVLRCSRYWNIECTTHMANEKQVTNFKNVAGRPTIVYFKSGHVEMGRVEGKMTATELIRYEEDVAKKWTGPKLGYAEWLEGKPDFDEANRLSKAKEWRKSIDGFLKLRRLSNARWREISTEALLAVNNEGDLLYGEAYKMSADPAKRKEGVQRLRQIVTDFKPLPCAQKAADALKAIAAH